MNNIRIKTIIKYIKLLCNSGYKNTKFIENDNDLTIKVIQNDYYIELIFSDSLFEPIKYTKFLYDKDTTYNNILYSVDFDIIPLKSIINLNPYKRTYKKDCKLVAASIINSLVLLEPTDDKQN